MRLGARRGLHEEGQVESSPNARPQHTTGLAVSASPSVGALIVRQRLISATRPDPRPTPTTAGISEGVQRYSAGGRPKKEKYKTKRGMVQGERGG